MFNLNPAAMKPQSEFGREREGGRFTFIAITTGVYIVTILVVSSLVARATCPSVMISSLGNEGMLPWSVACQSISAGTASLPRTQ